MKKKGTDRRESNIDQMKKQLERNMEEIRNERDASINLAYADLSGAPPDVSVHEPNNPSKGSPSTLDVGYSQ